MTKNAVLVTGASSGIGAEIARKLASENIVILTGRNKERLLHLRSEIPNSLALPCDLSSPNEIEALASTVESQLEKQKLKLTGLVNNAGIFTRKGFLETEVEEWQALFEVNMLGPVRLTRRLFNPLKASAPASVLNISSSLGLRPVPSTSAYAATKAAMVNWTEALALEWAPFRIRVNCICPGLVDTPIHPFHQRSESDEDRKLAHSRAPLKRMGTPSDIAEAAWFLLSEKSSWTTGTIMPVDGGVHL